jgi:6-phosphogluconolactonase (cycloisomerase 2 family)
MVTANKPILLFAALVIAVFMSGCGSSSMSSSSNPSHGTGTQSVPGFGAGIGASGQNGAARFLYVNPLPGSGPYAASIGSNGVLKLQTGGSANNINPMTMAIDPSGSFVFQTAQGYNGGTQGGVFVYAIDRTNGSLGTAVQSQLVGQTVFADVVDNQGKFLFVFSSQGVNAFSIQSGTGALTAVSGSPFATAPPSSLGYSQPATLMAVDQTNKFLYVSTSAGIAAFNIDQTTGQLTPVAGSPFGSSVSGPWAIVITPSNAFLYALQAKSSANMYGFSIDQSSGALTPLPGSPFGAGACGTTVPSGTVGVPGPDNMSIASAGKFLYDNCGIYSIDQSSGALTVVSSQGPGDWPVIDPTGDFLWAITGDQQACFHCDVGVTTYSVDPNTGALTAVPNSFLLLTNSAVGYINNLAITK